MGGSGTTKAVIAKLGHAMKGTLNPKDYEKTATRAKELGWENTTHWARQRMAEDGRMKNTSPNGTGEISNEGRVWLTKR